MENNDLLQWDKVKFTLQQAILDVENQILEEMEDEEEPESDGNLQNS